MDSTNLDSIDNFPCEVKHAWVPQVLGNFRTSHSPAKCGLLPGTANQPAKAGVELR